MNERHKKMNISTIIALISFTVFVMGGTTKWVLDFIDKRWPNQKVYRSPDDEESEISDGEDDK